MVMQRPLKTRKPSFFGFSLIYSIGLGTVMTIFPQIRENLSVKILFFSVVGGFIGQHYAIIYAYARQKYLYFVS
jgi:hypothetical protein